MWIQCTDAEFSKGRSKLQEYTMYAASQDLNSGSAWVSHVLSTGLARTVPPRVYSSRLQLLAALVTEAGGLFETKPIIFHKFRGWIHTLFTWWSIAMNWCSDLHHFMILLGFDQFLTHPRWIDAQFGVQPKQPSGLALESVAHLAMARVWLFLGLEEVQLITLRAA